MTIEQDISRIRELLEVMTEVVVEKAFAEDNSDDTRCSDTCLCDNEDEDEFSILSSVSVPVQFHGADALILAAAMTESGFTSTADFIRHATLAHIDHSLYPDNNEDDSSDNEADVEFVSVGFSRPAIVVPLLDWLTEQIHFAWRTKDIDKALFCEQIADKIDELRKRPAND